MLIAAIYDIHGNLPALEAVLEDIETAAPDLIVVGGDVAAGPLPGPTIERLRALGDRARFIRGNADRSADWIFIVTGYDLAVLRRLGDESLAPAAVAALGAASGAVAGWYTLSLSMARGENVASC